MCSIVDVECELELELEGVRDDEALRCDGLPDADDVEWPDETR